MIVMKFGGTSLADAEMFLNAAKIIQQEPRDKIVVVSAPAGLTDRLIGLTLKIKQKEKLLTELNGLENELIQLIKKTVLQALESITLKRFQEDFNKLKNKLISRAKKPDKQFLDDIISLGEVFSSLILSNVLRSKDMPCLRLPSPIKTDANFGQANIDWQKTDALLQDYKLCYLKEKLILVIPGFIGSTDDQKITTLGRGGSDYTATIIGAILDAEEIQLWKTESGVMTADPKIAYQVKICSRLSYEEACQISWFGAKVLHSKAVQPAAQKNIPIKIKNSLNPCARGTLIHQPEPNDSLTTIKVVSYINEVSLVSLRGRGMQGVKGILARAANVIKEQANIIMACQTSSEQGTTFVLKTEETVGLIQALEKEFQYELANQAIGAIEDQDNKAIVSIVGEGVLKCPTAPGIFLNALGQAQILAEVIGKINGECNISVVINAQDIQKAVNVVHRAFQLHL